MRHILSHPLLALVLGTALLGEIWYWGNYSRRHVALLAAPCCVLSVGGCYLYRSPQVVITDPGDDLQLLDIYSDEGDAMVTASAPPPELRGRATVFPQHQSTGLLAPIFTTANHSLHIYTVGDSPPFTPDELATIRAEFAIFLQEWSGGDPGWAPCIAALARGDGTLTRFHWSAALHDVAAALALGVTIAGTRRFFRECKERLRRLAIESAHLCPHCRYDIIGITDRCPECGLDLTI
jgi:hypothetical protein